VGGRQVQNAGTIGGNLCNASPAADGVPPLLALEAEVELVSAAGSRRLRLAEFLLGPRRTALLPGEVLAAVLIPEAALAGGFGFVKLGARSHLVISIAMVRRGWWSRAGTSPRRRWRSGPVPRSRSGFRRWRRRWSGLRWRKAVAA
jgi:CO/xanthine dehydrogenase FAD-binding subunit